MDKLKMLATLEHHCTEEKYRIEFVQLPESPSPIIKRKQMGNRHFSIRLTHEENNVWRVKL